MASTLPNMQVIRLPYAQVPQLAVKDKAYAGADPRLRPFYAHEMSISGFAQAIRNRLQQAPDRQLLVETLLQQYNELPASEPVLANIKSLADSHTFTVTTAHQPCLFTGPLYYIFKIISTIRLARELAVAYPDYRFVPVFINSGEDHDFEEVNHTFIFNKKLTWESGESGPVGRMKTSSLKPVLEELRSILGASDHAAGLYQLFEESYTRFERYSDATTYLVHQLFKSYGLIVLDPNKPALKRAFVPFVQRELIERPSKALVDQTAEALETAGFSGQAHAREINLFYLGEQFRERIVYENGRYEVLNTEIHFTEDAILFELQQHPERFSPNVIMRPVFQEAILPNLAYVGGGGELAYWLERKSQFELFGLPFPVLVRRNSVLWIDKNSMQRLGKLGLDASDLFEDTELLIKQYVNAQSESELNLESEKKQLLSLFESIKSKAQKIDPTLPAAVMAEHAKQLKVLEQLEGRLARAEKQRHETAIQQIRNLREKFFPGNGLQERYDNFSAYYVKYGPAFFDMLLAHLHPLKRDFLIMIEL